MRDPPPDPSEVCPACGAAAEPFRCKVVCPRCRTVVESCSDGGEVPARPRPGGDEPAPRG